MWYALLLGRLATTLSLFLPLIRIHTLTVSHTHTATEIYQRAHSFFVVAIYTLVVYF